LRLTSPRLAVVLGAFAAICVIVPAFADKPSSVLPHAESITVTALPIDFDAEHPDRKEFGKLIFRGGVSLFANSPSFGGYSALAIDPSGKTLLAISDAGTWLRATLDHDGRLLKGVSNAVIGPILGDDGKPLRDDAMRDSEGLTLIEGTPSGGVAYISFERNQRIMRYPFTADSFGPPKGQIQLPAEAKRLEANRGVEALAILRGDKLKGTLVALPERLATKAGDLQGWLIGGPTPGPITLRSIGGFDITDAAALPDGGILVLERRFRYSEGVKMRIRRIAADEIKRGGLIVGETLLEADDRFNIDNMEGIAAHQAAASGETIITLISDDNFSALQRTLILQFALPMAKPKLAEPER
jgi:hypothetical protein